MGGDASSRATINPTQTGKYTANNGSSVCEPCASPFTTSGAGATSCDACEKGSYLDLTGVCRTCPEGVKCDTPGKLETLELKPGWSRVSFTSKRVYECTTGNCLGGNSSTCQDGSGGVLCAVCDGMFRGLNIKVDTNFAVYKFQVVTSHAPIDPTPHRPHTPTHLL